MTEQIEPRKLRSYTVGDANGLIHPIDAHTAMIDDSGFLKFRRDDDMAGGWIAAFGPGKWTYYRNHGVIADPT